MKSDDSQPLSTKSTYLITFLLGFAFSITLMQSTWKTAIERKQKDFHFEILSIQQSVASNVLAGNDVTNNVAAFISSNDVIASEQFASFTDDILRRYAHVEAVNYYAFTDGESSNEFRLVYARDRGKQRIKIDTDIYSDLKYIDAIDTSISTRSVVPAPPDLESDPDRKYWLFKPLFTHDDELPVSDINQKKYAGHVKGMVSVLISPTKLLGLRGQNKNLTITMFSDTSNLYGRQLLYYDEPEQQITDKPWRIETLSEEKLIQLPPYSIRIIIEKNLHLSELEYHLLFVAVLISIGILMMLFGLVRTRIKREEELKSRNAVIEQQVEKQTQELAIARDEALEAARLKSEFLASMSHEIRTPLNAIIGMSDLMSETSLTKEQNRYVGVFKKAGDALLSLVNDILDLSKIEAKQLVLEDIPFNLCELIEEAADIYALKAADKDIEIITRMDAGVNLNRIGDPGRLKQIILNLISNALKFTDEGEIVITLSADLSSDKIITIAVSDTGIGIPKDKLESIFASFTQADASTTRKYGGTGLGLTISRHLTEMMNGNIRVESEVNKGSCFYVQIELSEQTEPSVLNKDFNDKTIIVLDQRKSNRLGIEELLHAEGAKCFTATEIDEAKKHIEKEPGYDALLIDSQMLFSNQEQDQFLASVSSKNKIILLVNPKQMAEHNKLARSKGIDKLLIKPIKRSELRRDLYQIIEPGIDIKEKTLEHEDINIVVKPKHILLVEDNPDNRMLIKAYLKKSPHSMDEAENGEIAVNLFKTNDYDLVLMDVQMPVMDGHEATRQIRAWEQDEDKPRTPIISLTAHAIKEEIDKCLAAGCDTHMSKPVKKAALLQTINEI